jgi:uracil-DNA glycosylase family 4
MSGVCPSCASDCVPPRGPKTGDILLIGEFPSTDELAQLKPFCGPAGGVLRTELARHGIDLWNMLITNVWLHAPNDNENCFQAGFEECIKLAKGKKAILLIGSQTVEYFTDHKVSDVTGLEVSSKYLSAPLIMATYNPAIAFHRPVGEIRFAISAFANKLKEMELV